jgi:branched-chain amino acid transport system substrate-binding protein
MKRFLSSAALAAAVVTLALAVPAAASPAEEVVVGVVHWEGFAYAEMMRRSYEMALADIEGAAGARTLRLVFADDGGERRDGEAAVERLVRQEGAALLIGGYSSSNTLYTAMAADRMGVPFLVTTAADDRITQRGLEWVYRLNPPASDYTGALEAFLLERVAPRSMAIVYENSPYGTGAAMQMMWFCRENDIEITSIIPYIRGRAGEEYFERILAPLRSRAPDVLYMVSYLDDGVALVTHLRKMGVSALLCGGAGGFTHNRFIREAGPAGDRLVTAALWAPEAGHPGAQAYWEAYRERFGAPPDYHGAEAYAALRVAAEALSAAGALDPRSIRGALEEIDLETLFGRVRFTQYDAYERQNRTDTLVLQVQEGRYRCIWPEAASDGGFDPPPDWRR